MFNRLTIHTDAPACEPLSMPLQQGPRGDPSWPQICAAVRDYAESMALGMTVQLSRELARDAIANGSACAHVPDATCGTYATLTVTLTQESTS